MIKYGGLSFEKCLEKSLTFDLFSIYFEKVTYMVKRLHKLIIIHRGKMSKMHLISNQKKTVMKPGVEIRESRDETRNDVARKS